MRSIPLIIVLYVLFVNTSFSQERTRIQLGVQAGLTGSFFTDRIGPYGDNSSEDYSQYVRFGVMAGFSAQYNLTEVIGIGFELNYSQKGGSYRMENDGVFNIGGSGDDQSFYYKNYRLNYFEIPLLASVNISKLINKSITDKDLNLTFHTGIAYIFNTNSSLRYNDFYETGSSSGPLVDIESSYSVENIGHAMKINMTYIANVGFHFPIAKKIPSFVNIRYEHALYPVYDVRELAGNNMQTKMGTISLSIGVVAFKR